MGLFDAMANIMSTGITNNENRNLTMQQWERDDNAHQREVADLRAAGLNPVLAAGQQAQSSPPARMVAPQFSDTIGGSARAWAAIQQAKTSGQQVLADLEGKKIQNNLMREQQRESVKRQELIDNQRVETMERKLTEEYNRGWYKDNGLPVGATGDVARFAQARSMLSQWIKEHQDASPVLLEAIRNLMGGSQ